MGMTIPLDDEGRFEAVDGGGAVVAEGRVELGAVEFRYGDRDADGNRTDVIVLPLPEFEATWQSLPQSNYLTLRAAAG